MDIKNVKNGARMRKLWIYEVRGTNPDSVSELTTWAPWMTLPEPLDVWRMPWRFGTKLTTWIMKTHDVRPKIHPINRNRGQPALVVHVYHLSYFYTLLSPSKLPRSPGNTSNTRRKSRSPEFSEKSTSFQSKFCSTFVSPSSIYQVSSYPYNPHF